MKKVFTLALALLCVLSLTGCSTKDVDSPKSTKQQQDINKASLGKVLVVYFSIPETTDAKDMSEEEANSTVVKDGEVLGNTQYVAQLIQKELQADLFRIETKTPYPIDHETLVSLAKTQQEEKDRPSIKAFTSDMAAYDTIFIGYPTWWSDLPMPVYTFFDTYNLKGKNIIPFNTHGGSGFADTITNITKLEPKASVFEEGLSISRDDVENADQEVIDWLQTLTNE